MKFRPGLGLAACCAALAAWSLVGLFWRASAWLIPPTLLAAVVLSWLDRRGLRRAFAQIEIGHELPASIGRGAPFSAVLVIANRSAERCAGEVRMVLPLAAEPPWFRQAVDLPAGGEVRLAQSFMIAQRGRHVFGPVWLRLRGRFGFLEGQRSFATSGTIRVFPESLVSREGLAQDMADEVRLLDKLRNSKHRGAGTEFESLEEFRTGDDPRRIDWRATARLRRPVVRRYQIERHRDLMILIDCGRLMGADARQGTKLDCAVDAALRLARVALRTGDRCGLGVFDNRVLGYLRPISGGNALPTFVSSIYDLQPRWNESDFSLMFGTLQARQTKRALVVVLSDVVDAETSGRFRASLATLARRHVVLFGALQTPQLDEIVNTPVTAVLDGFRQAVALRTLREREQAIHSLRRGGVHVLDVKPNELTVPLVNQFIELRRVSVL